MDVQVLDDQLELVYNSSVWTQDVVLKTYPRQWIIETNGERVSGKSMLAAHDDIFKKKTNAYIFATSHGLFIEQ